MHIEMPLQPLIQIDLKTGLVQVCRRHAGQRQRGGREWAANWQSWQWWQWHL